MPDVLMPRLSSDMQEGTIAGWLKGDGDLVARGEEIASIETDKAEVAYEAQAEGVLRIFAPEGSTVAVGERIASIGGDGPAADDPGVEARGSQPSSAVSAATAERSTIPPVAGTAGSGPVPDRVSASPIARRTAAGLGIDLASLSGTGPRGRIVKADVVRAAAAEPPAAAPRPVEAAKGATVEVGLSRVQQTIARRMSESRSTVPDFAVEVDVALDDLLELREQLKRVHATAPSVTDAIVRAAALTLRRHPKVNGSYRDGSLVQHDRVNVGIAVASDAALLVPVVPDADKLTLTEIAAESRRLIARARDGSVTPPELSGGTFTVSNLGMFGVDRFAGVVNLPQAAILCVGATRPRPAVLADGSLGVRQLATLTLVSDHRIVYGADAAAFLSDLRVALEEPLRLFS